MAYPIINRLRKNLKISLLVISLFFLCTLFFASLVFTEDRDIGLRLRDNNENVPVAICSEECPDSPLKIYKGNTYGIKLVDPGDSSATKMQVETSSGTKAVKKYVPITGNFVTRPAGPLIDKYKKTWVASITVACANGRQTTIGLRANGRAYPLDVTTAVRDAIARKGLNITPPEEGIPLRRSTDGSGSGSTWVVRTYDTMTLEAICKILGYDSYVSSTGQDNQRDRQYRNGKCYWDSPQNNEISYFE